MCKEGLFYSNIERYSSVEIYYYIPFIIYAGEHLCYYICVNVYFESKAVSMYVQEQ